MTAHIVCPQGLLAGVVSSVTAALVRMSAALVRVPCGPVPLAPVGRAVRQRVHGRVELHGLVQQARHVDGERDPAAGDTGHQPDQRHSSLVFT